MIDGNKLGEVGFQKLGTPYSEMDCQAFVEWCLRQCGCNKDLAGSNAWYREVAKNGVVMTPEECVSSLGEVPIGAFLFIVSQDGKEPDKYKPDGMGNASHIGLCTGNKGKGAIHSSASRGCVAESEFHGKTIKNGGWNMVGLWNQVEYDYSGGDTPEPTPGLTAIVGNVPAGKRQDVNLRKRPSTLSMLIDRVPCGDTVEVASFEDDWSLVKWKDKTGYMMSKFLIMEEPFDYYTVIIEHLSKAEAEEITSLYGGEMRKE